MQYQKTNINGVELWRVDNDANGNSRHVFHFLELSTNYNEACAIARKFGGKKYRGKWFGGGIVVQSNPLQDLAHTILSHRVQLGNGATQGKGSL